MKNMKIKLLSVMISALLCSHLWAQGSESAGDWFYITMDDSQKNYKSIQITTENGKHKIIDGLVPNSNSTGYTAFFIGDNGSYYIYDKKNNKNSWFVADNEEIDAINKLYSFVNNKNSTVTSEEKDIYIKNAGYALVDKSLINIKKSEYNPVRTKNNGYSELYIYDAIKGVFGFALYPEDSDMVQIICFRDTKSIAEITNSVIGTSDNPYNDFFTWLKKTPENKISDNKNEEYKRVAQLIYESLKNKSAERCYNLYTSNNLLFRKYLQLAQQESRNVFSPEKKIHYETVNDDDAKKIVDEADKYINTVIKLKIKLKNVDIVVPMPYKADKKNTPEDLKNIKKQKDLIKIGCDDKSFIAEILKKSIKRDDLYNSFNDISKYSLLISDVNDARVGDLIFFEYDTMQQGFSNIQGQKCGIIVETPKVNEGFGTYQKSSLGNLSVIWMNEENGAEKKKLSEIWNIGDDFEVPLYTEIRRVLKTTEIKDNEIYWNVLNDEDPEIKVEIGCMRENTQNSAERYRWIPNTGEYLSLERISINAYNKIGIRLRGEKWNVTLNGAIDRDWKESNTEGNIYNNSNCKFDIKVGDYDAKLIKGDNNRYIIRWGFSDEDFEKASFKIEGSDNILKYSDTNEVAEILIRPESAEKARPGDDLLLEFKISNGSIEKEVTVSPKDYIAVYDKKMLWRANLYINKPEVGLAGSDWNDAHPWNAPVNNNDTTNIPDWWDNNWGYNKWNISSNISGGQIDIKPWTRFVKANGEWNVYNSVAYGYGCGDDIVEDFNEGLKDQSEAMIKMKNNDSNYPPSGTVEDGQTTAPDQKWGSYIFPASSSQYEYKGKKLLGKNPSQFFKRTSSESKVKIPGFSTWWLSQDLVNYKYYNSDQCTYTLGIDCSGLVHRCSLYDGNKYKTQNETIHNINASMFAGKKYDKVTDSWIDEAIPTYSYPIFKASTANPWKLEVFDSDDSDNVLQRDNQRQLLTHTVPGDILVKDGHVVYVQNINYHLNSELITDYSQVEVIHSTSGLKNEDSTWMVNKGTWANIETNVSIYQLRRLKEQ